MNDHLRTLVIPCAGRGSRMGCSSSKTLLRARGKPLLQYIVDFWRDACRKWLIILNPDDVETATFAETLGIDFQVIIQEEPRGIGHAVSLAGDFVSGPFTVVLGDCVVSGEFEDREIPECGIGIWEQGGPGDVTRNYGVILEDGGTRVGRVHEKPAHPEGMKCGMGAYFFSPEIFSAIRNTPPDAGGDVQITAALQAYIDSGGLLVPVPFNGSYVNVNDRTDLDRIG